jgi:hypothetical protein
MENVESMISGVAATLRLLAEVTTANPDFFRTESGNNALFRALTTAYEIDAAFVSFEDQLFARRKPQSSSDVLRYVGERRR